MSDRTQLHLTTSDKRLLSGMKIGTDDGMASATPPDMTTPSQAALFAELNAAEAAAHNWRRSFDISERQRVEAAGQAEVWHRTAIYHAERADAHLNVCYVLLVIAFVEVLVIAGMVFH